MKVIVVSAVNLRSGGPLSVLKDSLRVLNDEFSATYKVIALVHKKEIFEEFKKIEFVEFPNSIGSYFYRIYLEYFYFKKLSKQLKPYLWFSLHDITPNVRAEKRAVYCHNPAPFYSLSGREMLLDPGFLVLNFVYSFFYKKNILDNDYVVVQQAWLREEFEERFFIDNVVVAYPSLDSVSYLSKDVDSSSKVGKRDKFIFFYPAFPRVFKNLEVLCEAVKVLVSKGVAEFELWLTIDGTENKYSKFILDNYSELENVKYKGLQSREEVFEMYRESDALLFPSKLETWGLPITEYKNTNKPMIVADLPYAHETVGEYQNVTFFSPDDVGQLAVVMNDLIDKKFIPQGNKAILPKDPHVTGWKELFDFMLKEK